MSERRGIRQLDAHWQGHRVDAQFYFGRLQRPRRVMNVCVAQAAAAVYRVKTISIRKPTVERLRSGTIDFSGGFVRRVQFRPGASPIGTDAAIVNSFSLWLQSHSGIIVRQTIQGSSGSNRQPICRIKAEKTDAASARTSHVGSNLQLLEGQPGKARETVRADAARAERDDADPSGAIESIELQPLGNQWSNQVRNNRPMQKQQIVPTHGHNPGSGWKGPGPMIGFT